ncbi:hypothetical protein JL722_571 [Aureococcus anophagefferens]|nr:hypothetical protein JL722_571 [Aureococcus anophagefferens]
MLNHSFPAQVLSAHVGDGKLGVVLSNFGVQHVQWSKTVADAKRTLKPFTRAAFDRLHCDKPKIRTHLVQFGGVAVHGFREPYVTYNRSRVFSDVPGPTSSPCSGTSSTPGSRRRAGPRARRTGCAGRRRAPRSWTCSSTGCREGADAMEVAGCATN